MLTWLCVAWLATGGVGCDSGVGRGCGESASFPFFLCTSSAHLALPPIHCHPPTHPPTHPRYPPNPPTHPQTPSQEIPYDETVGRQYGWALGALAAQNLAVAVSDGSKVAAGCTREGRLGAAAVLRACPSLWVGGSRLLPSCP